MSPLPIHPCNEDHMHTWKMETLGDYGWYCTAAGDDATTPAQDAEMSYVIEDIEWVSVKAPVLKNLAEMVADAKNEIVSEVESSVLSDLPRNPVGIESLLERTAENYKKAWRAETAAWLNSPFYKIMRQRNEEIRLLYGTMTNYFLVMEYKPQPEGAASPRTSTNTESK